MLLIDNRGMDDAVDPEAPRDLIRAQSLRWRAVGCVGSDRAALLSAAVVLERMAVSGADGGQGAPAVRAPDGAAHGAGHAASDG